MGDPFVHGILSRLCRTNTPRRVLCSSGPRVNASELTVIIGGVHGGVRGLNNRIHLRYGIRGLVVCGGFIRKLACSRHNRLFSVRTSDIVVTVNRDTESAIRVLCGLNYRVVRGPFSINTQVRRPRGLVGGTRCNSFTNGRGLNTTSCGLTYRNLRRHKTCAFYVYPNKAIITTTDRGNNIVMGNVDDLTHSKRGTGDTLLINVRPGSFPGRRPLTKVCCRERVRRGTFLLNNNSCGTPTRLINSFLTNGTDAGLNSMGPAYPAKIALAGVRGYLPRGISTAVGDTVIRVSGGLDNFTLCSTILATPRAEDSDSMQVLHSRFYRDGVDKVCPYNRNTNCTNNVISTTISKVGYTRTILNSRR